MTKSKFILLFFLFLFPAEIWAQDLDKTVQDDFFSASDDSPFKVRPVVSVIISGTSDAHVSEVLSTALSLSKKVPVRNIAIIANGDDMQRFSTHGDEAFNGSKSSITKEEQAMLDKLGAGIPKIPKNPFDRLFKELRLSTSEMKAGDQLRERLRISYSPTWVVRFEGKDYVYEGYPNISRMFDAKGGFRPE